MPPSRGKMSTWLPIVTFHEIDEEPALISVAPGVFRRGMAGLEAKGFQSLTLRHAAGLVRESAGFPERTLVITFDDGFRSVYEEAFPVLQRHGMSATVFLTAGRPGPPDPSRRLPSFEGRDMLSWAEVREMQRHGVDFGAHTLSHPDLTGLDDERIRSEILGAKAVLEDGLGRPVTSFAYPYGRFDRRVREIVRRHFDCACSDRLGLVTAHSDLFALERVDAYYLRTDRLFALMGTNLLPWYLRLRKYPRQVRRVVQGKARR